MGVGCPSIGSPVGLQMIGGFLEHRVHSEGCFFRMHADLLCHVALAYDPKVHDQAAARFQYS